ncbi:MAG: hypothetical protein U5L45_07385 [Saprospiraceae bacterium]|nr:hypothetical protein [Saprospiraceae bacterium]
MWFIFSAKPENEPPLLLFARAKRAQKCLLMRILNLCMVSKQKKRLDPKKSLAPPKTARFEALPQNLNYTKPKVVFGCVLGSLLLAS